MAEPAVHVYCLHHRVEADGTAGRRVTDGRLDGTALAGNAAAAGGLAEDETVEINHRGREREVGLGLGAAELHGLGFVGPGGFLGRVECAEPQAAPLARVPDLRRVPAPRPLPHPPIPHLLCHSAAAALPRALRLSPAADPL